MRKSISVVVIAVAGFVIATAAFGIEVPLNYEKYDENQQTFRPFGAMRPQMLPEPPEGEWKLPDPVGDKPLYTVIKLADSDRLSVIDRQKPDDPYYNRIYFDSNGNGDMTDDPAVDGTIRKFNDDYYNVTFPVIDTEIKVDGAVLPYSFMPQVSGMGFEKAGDVEITAENIRRYVNCYFEINCSYSAEFQMDGRSYRVMLGDTDGNGRFNDRFSIPENFRSISRMPVYAQGDQFYISGTGNIDFTDRQVCGDFVMVNGKLYEVEISTARGKLTLTEVTEGLVPLKLAMETERLALYSEDGEHCLNMYKPESTVLIPAGNYRLLSYQAFRDDEQGDRWRLIAGGSTESPVVSVEQNNGAVLEFGEPFVPIVETQNVGRGSSGEGASDLPLLFNVEGTGRELLTELIHMSGTKTKIPLSKTRGRENRPKEPSYRIVKSDGEIVAVGSFEYG